MENLEMPQMIFLNTAWMTDYRGITREDGPMHGGEYITENEFGSEIFNFLPFEGYLYGYVQPPRGGGSNPRGIINIERMGASWLDESLNGILVIWVARSESLGSVIVGWYKDATVFGEVQAPPANSNRIYDGEGVEYYVKTKAENGFLIPASERKFKIPRGKGWMGQANTWYADQDTHGQFKRDVLKYIEKMERK
ncbi:MAG: hypothetical protein ABIE84_07410 [bacterium]